MPRALGGTYLGCDLVQPLVQGFFGKKLIKAIMFKFGWFSSGRDQAAIDLFTTTFDRMEEGFIKGRISFVFCDRELGDTPDSDRFLKVVQDRGVPIVTHSSRELRNKIIHSCPDINKAREEFDSQVIELLKPFKVEVVVMAGYMLIISPLMCNTFLCLNLHPAAPRGPKGTWQQVMWQIIASGIREAGGMMHVAIPELDAGPPVTYFRLPLDGPTFEALWANLSFKKCTQSLEEIKNRENESEPLFARIREEELRREFPLIILTLKCLADGSFYLTHEGAKKVNGEALLDGYDVTKKIETYIKKYGPNFPGKTIKKRKLSAPSFFQPELPYENSAAIAQ